MAKVPTVLLPRRCGGRANAGAGCYDPVRRERGDDE